MDILFKDDEQKEIWTKLKNNSSDDQYAKKIIDFVESWALNMQSLLGEDPEKIVFKEDWDKRTKEVFTGHSTSIQLFQQKLWAETLYESQFQKIIKKAMELAGANNLTKEELKCASSNLCQIWKYGSQLDFELSRKVSADELRKNLKIEDDQ